MAGLAAPFAASPNKVAIASSPSATALARWAARQTAVERLRGVTSASRKAKAKLPAWVIPGLDRIDQCGNACGDYVGWPLDRSVTPPKVGERVVRPSLRHCREQFEFEVRVFQSNQAGRARARATMRARMRSVIARLRERDRLCEELGLAELDRQMEDVTDAIITEENFFYEWEDTTPNVVAARVMIGLTNDCDRNAFAEGNGYCGTMAMALVALKGLFA